jgi:hypothetical protein
MEEILQHEETAECTGLTLSCPGNHRSHGQKAGHTLKFTLGHSKGSGHVNIQFSKADHALKGIGLDYLTKTEDALSNLCDKNMAP